MGTYTYNKGTVSIACGTVGFPPGTTDVVHQEVLTILKDERPVKPRPLSNTNMEIWRYYNNAARVVRGSRYGSVGYTHSGMSYTLKEESTEGLGNTINQAKKKLGEGRMNLGVTLVELDDTARMVKSNGLRVLGALRALVTTKNRQHAYKMLGVKPGRRRDAKVRDALEKSDFTGAWLEMQFGWMPLLNDIYGAVAAYHDGIKTRGILVSGSAGKRYKNLGNQVRRLGKSTIHSTAGVSVWSDSDPLKGRELARRAKFTGRVSNPALRSLQELGLINPALLAWNRMAYSFVIDWILPIGTFLAGLTAGAGLTQVRGYTIREWRQTKTFSRVS